MKLFRIVLEVVTPQDIEFLVCFPLKILEILFFRVIDDFGVIVEKNSRTPITQQVSETIFTGVVYPLFNKDFSISGILTLATFVAILDSLLVSLLLLFLFTNNGFYH